MELRDLFELGLMAWFIVTSWVLIINKGKLQ